MNKLLHNNTLFTLTLLGIATALAFLFFSFVSENTANIALLYIIAQILIARYTNGYLLGLFSSQQPLPLFCLMVPSYQCNKTPELTVTDHPDHVTFCVKDFGHGLNPDVIPDIFSGICHNTGSVDSHKGMGIGLSICKTIIDAHNGYIEAKNHTNGALFLFTLPKAKEENIPCSQK